MFCIGQLGLITSFHEQIHKMINNTDAFSGISERSQYNNPEKECDGNCSIMQNSETQDSNSKSQNSQKTSLTLLSAHTTSDHLLIPDLNSTLYSHKIISEILQGIQKSDTPPPRFS